MRRSLTHRLIHLVIIIATLSQLVVGVTSAEFRTASVTDERRSQAAASLSDSISSAGERTISITDDGFVPAEITIVVGQEVTWVNNGTKPYSIVASEEVEEQNLVYLPLVVSAIRVRPP